MINRRHLVQLLALTPVAAALPAVATGVNRADADRAARYAGARANFGLLYGPLHIWQATSTSAYYDFENGSWIPGSNFMVAVSAEEAAHLFRQLCQKECPDMDTDPASWPEIKGRKAEHWVQWPTDKVFPLTKMDYEVIGEADAFAASKRLRDWNVACERARKLGEPDPQLPNEFEDNFVDPPPGVRPKITWQVTLRNTKRPFIRSQTILTPPAELVKYGPGLLGWSSTTAAARVYASSEFNRRVSPYSVWYASDPRNAGKFLFMTASSAKDADLRYHAHIGGPGTVQGLGPHPKEWKQWPTDRMVEIVDRVDESAGTDASCRIWVLYPSQVARHVARVGPGYLGSTELPGSGPLRWPSEIAG